MRKIKVIDVFAGPGGLGEGFARFSPAGSGGQRPFEIVLSAEMEPAAVHTLRLRTFYRLCELKDGVPDSYYRYLAGKAVAPFDDSTEAFWKRACNEVKPLELGSPKGNRRLREGLEKGLGQSDDWILIGGPPCQAYSLVGRSRNRGKSGYRPEKDKRHFLYRHYLRILSKHRPAAFVMENVKGILSSRVRDNLIFPQILRDLSAPNGKSQGKKGVRYRIHSLSSDQVFNPGDDPEEVDARNFIVRAEDYELPQARHRVILVGIREDASSASDPVLLDPSNIKAPADWALKLPPLRSGLSKGDSDFHNWRAAILDAIQTACGLGMSPAIATRMRRGLGKPPNTGKELDRGGRFVKVKRAHLGRSDAEKRFLQQVQSSRLGGIPNHETRGHSPMDLARYLFAITFAEEYGYSPKAWDFPEALAPDHKNWNSGHFADRFRVQVYGQPSSTVTSHLSKDGHYFIHPDPTQCRSLTVREAARLQTFPDDYFFEGSRSEQYVQVGNAVPPMLARKIAEIIFNAIC